MITEKDKSNKCNCNYLTKTQTISHFPNLQIGDVLLIWVEKNLSYNPLNTIICLGEQKINSIRINGGFKGVIQTYDCRNGKMIVIIDSIIPNSLLGYD